MFHDDRRAFIDHHVERLFKFVDPKRHPLLYRMHCEFYDDPVFNTNQCNELVHELIALRVSLETAVSEKYLISLIDRLLPFFSQTFQANGEVRCVSD